MLVVMADLLVVMAEGVPDRPFSVSARLTYDELGDVEDAILSWSRSLRIRHTTLKTNS